MTFMYYVATVPETELNHPIAVFLMSEKLFVIKKGF